MNIEEALGQLGVTSTTLSDEEKRQLDEEGYLILTDFIGHGLLKALQDKYEELMEREGQNAGKEFQQEAGTRRLSDLINKGQEFDICWQHPKILAIAYHVIGKDFKVNSINGRDALPGQGHQDLHADWGPRRLDDLYGGVNTIWLLDDFTPDNGATRFVPATHKLAGSPKDYVVDVRAPHPDEQLVIAKAGTVFAYNMHMWHGGTQNRTNKTRRVLHPSFIAREFPQQYNQKEFLRKSTYDRLSPAARYILDVDE